MHDAFMCHLLLFFFRSLSCFFFETLSSLIASSLLLLGVMIFFYFALNTPRWGWSCTLGILCLSLIFFSHFSLEKLSLKGKWDSSSVKDLGSDLHRSPHSVLKAEIAKGASVQKASWFEVILLLIGISLILLELFIIPGFGLPGIIGVVISLTGLFALLLPDIREVHFDPKTNTLNAAGQFFIIHLACLIGTFSVGVAIISLLARFHVRAGLE